MLRRVVIVDEEQRRDPMQYELYRYLLRSSRIRFSFYQGGPLPPCDALFLGFNFGRFLDQLMPSLASTPVVLGNADIECLVDDRQVRQLFQSGSVQLLFTKYYPSPRLDAFADSVGLSPSRIRLIPWACDPAVYEGHADKDLDVCYTATIEPTWKYHRHRQTIAAVVRSFPSSFVGNVYGSDYLQVLHRSKILIVDGSDRHAMTQRYIEGAMCRCLLVGDVPTIPDIAARYFVDGETMAGTHDDWSTLRARIRYYLDHEDQRQKIASACHAGIASDFTLARWGEQLQDDVARTLGWQ